MRLRFTVLIALLYVARANGSKSSAVVVPVYDSPLKCFVTNKDTGIASLEICNPAPYDDDNKPYNNPRAVCTTLKLDYGTKHYCETWEEVRYDNNMNKMVAADCDPTACIEYRKKEIHPWSSQTPTLVGSYCCCLTNGCNVNMLPPRPKQ